MSLIAVICMKIQLNKAISESDKIDSEKHIFVCCIVSHCKIRSLIVTLYRENYVVQFENRPGKRSSFLNPSPYFVINKANIKARTTRAFIGARWFINSHRRKALFYQLWFRRYRKCLLSLAGKRLQRSIWIILLSLWSFNVMFTLQSRREWRLRLGHEASECRHRSPHARRPHRYPPRYPLRLPLRYHLNRGNNPPH